MELVGIRRTGVYNLGLAGKLETELGGIILVCKLKRIFLILSLYQVVKKIKKL